MLRPKIEGTVLLERLTRSLELDFVVLFSSTTALLGASGMAHYAAANAFLDATAVALNDSSGGNVRHTLSVNWGTWEAMRLASAESQRSYREGGLEPIPAADALGALGQLLRGREAQATVARINWNVLKPLHEARRVRPLLTHLGNEDVSTSGAIRPDQSVATEAAGAPALLERLAQAPATMRHELLIDFVRGEAAAVLGVESGEAVALDVGLFEMGMDSLMSVELRRRLERGAGRKLPSTLTFNYPNVGALARFLERELVVARQAAEPATTAPVVQPAPAVAANDNLDELSEAELEARLLARLSETR
jgi:acyl carrier protein